MHYPNYKLCYATYRIVFVFERTSKEVLNFIFVEKSKPHQKCIKMITKYNY